MHQVVRGSGRPILVLHGAGLDHRHMLDAIEPVFEGVPGWRRVYVDLPGHGKTPAAGVASQDDVLAMIAEFADEAFGAGYAVIGESRGAYLAAGLAHVRADAVAGLMLIVPGGNDAIARTMRPPHRTLRPDPALRGTLHGPEAARFDRLVVQNADILEKIRRTKIPASALQDEEAEAKVQANFAFSFDLHTSARGFGKPALILSGRQDAIAGFADTIDTLGHYPRATYGLLDCAGHSLAWERPALFLALTRDWLQRLEPEFPA